MKKTNKGTGILLQRFSRRLTCLALDSINCYKFHSAAKQAVSFFGTFKNLHMVARGNDLVTAGQWALIIKEGAGVFSEALSAGIFRHATKITSSE